MRRRGSGGLADVLGDLARTFSSLANALLGINAIGRSSHRDLQTPWPQAQPCRGWALSLKKHYPGQAFCWCRHQSVRSESFTSSCTWVSQLVGKAQASRSNMAWLEKSEIFDGSAILRQKRAVIRPVTRPIRGQPRDLRGRGVSQRSISVGSCTVPDTDSGAPFQGCAEP